jgi:hypothetical protein
VLRRPVSRSVIIIIVIIIKGKVVSVLNTKPLRRMEGGFRDPRFLDLGTSCR